MDLASMPLLQALLALYCNIKEAYLGKISQLASPRDFCILVSQRSNTATVFLKDL